MQLGLAVNRANLSIAEEPAEGNLADKRLEGSRVVVWNSVEEMTSP